MRDISFVDIHSRLPRKVTRVNPDAWSKRLFGRLVGIEVNPDNHYRFIRDRRSGNGKHYWLIAECSDWSPLHLKELKNRIVEDGFENVHQVEVGDTAIRCYQPAKLSLEPVTALSTPGFYLYRDICRCNDKLSSDDLHTDAFIYNPL